MQTVIDNILINHEILGQKNENTILILHGWKNSLKNWEEVGKKLSNKNKVVLVDLPGFGNSSVPKNQPFDTYDYAQTINRFIEKLNLQNITLMGHSFGGKIGTIIASDNPKIKKLILVDNSGITNRNIVTSLKMYVFKIIKFFLPKKLSEKFSNTLSSEDYKNAGSLRESFSQIVKQDTRESAKKINAPTLIVWGENDKDVPLSSAKILKEIIPNSTLRIVWRTTHHPHLEKPDKFMEIIEEYI